MPPLDRPIFIDHVNLPPRRVQIIAECDVLVVGGGPAGLGAALGAAQAGAQVILAERYGFLGGNATASLVMPLMSFHTEQIRQVREGKLTMFPVDHGPGEPIIGGVVSLLVERLVKMGGAIKPSLETSYVVPFDPEIFKMAALDLLDEAGVQFLLHALATEVYDGGNVRGVVFETKSGTVVIRARNIVDCTGDGDIATRAGAQFEIGREQDQMVQPITLMFRMGDFSREMFEAYVREHPDQWRGVHGLWDLVQRANDAGDLNLPREDILFFGTPHANEVIVNSTRVTNVLGTSVWDLTFAEWTGRRQLRQITAFLRRYVPGFEDAYNIQSGVQVGVRESRRIIGDYRLVAEDILEARKFDDAIARGTYPIDIHNPIGKGTILKKIPEGEAYEIPLRCLLPKGVDNVLVAGRCISGTHQAHSAYRVMPISMATGHAAGICAALASRAGQNPRQVPVEQVQEELVRQGANLRLPDPGI